MLHIRAAGSFSGRVLRISSLLREAVSPKTGNGRDSERGIASFVSSLPRLRDVSGVGMAGSGVRYLRIFQRLLDF